GAVDSRLSAFLASHVHQVDGALAAASATDKPKRRAKQLGKARRGLTAITKRVTKDARRKRHPLAAGCRDAILSLVGAVPQAPRARCRLDPAFDRLPALSPRHPEKAADLLPDRRSGAVLGMRHEDVRRSWLPDQPDRLVRTALDAGPHRAG